MGLQSKSAMLAVLLALAALSGCAGDNDPADPGADPEAVVRAYVDSLNARDGRRFCELVAPYISGRFDLAARDPDGQFARDEGCADLVHGFIGYIEDCCPPEFKRANIEELHEGASHGDLRRFDLRVGLEVENTTGDHRRHTEHFRDVVWVARFGGAWRVAKLGKVAAAASLVWTPIETGEEGELFKPPDIPAETSEYQAALSSLRNLLAERRASYVTPGTPADCSGGLAKPDPADDVTDPRADLRLIRLRTTNNERVCVAFETAAAIKGPIMFSLGLSPRARGLQQGQLFQAELREDGKVRVVGGYDDQRHSLSVPATVGAGGKRFTLVLDADSFEAGEPSGAGDFDLSLISFAFRARVTVPLADGNAIIDEFGRGSLGFSYAYPGGWRCGLGDQLCSKARAGMVRRPGDPPTHPTITPQARRIRPVLTRTCRRFGGHVARQYPTQLVSDLACFVRIGNHKYALPTDDDGRFVRPPGLAAGRRMCRKLDRGNYQTGRMIAEERERPFRVKVSVYRPTLGICQPEARTVIIRP